jgi:Na+-transporting NADH:ubiquinone oxidoreductase subunit D
MTMPRLSNTVTDPIIDQNPISVQILGICSALAVTTSVTTALTMSLAVIAVLVLGNVIISLIRHHIPISIRLIIQIVIIASFVIVIDQFLQAYAFSISQRLSIFVSLVVTNCLVLGRAEAFAMHNPVGPSILDAIGNGLGYSVVLLTVGGIREFFGSGTLLGMTVLPLASEGGWYPGLGLMLLAPSAFFILGLLIWVIRSIRPAQVEPDEYPLAADAQEARP